MTIASPSFALTLVLRLRAALHLLVLCVLACLPVFQAGCDDSEAAASDKQVEAAPELPYFEGEVIRVPPAFAERIGIKTSVAAVTEISPVVYVTGVLEFDEQRIAAVGSRISGRVRQVKVIEGTKVEPGDVLATMESAELGKAQAEIFSVKARAQYADTDERRKLQLLKEGIASQRAVELGEVDILEVFVARENFLRIQNEALEAYRAYYEAVFSLETLLGSPLTAIAGGPAAPTATATGR